MRPIRLHWKVYTTKYLTTTGLKVNATMSGINRLLKLGNVFEVEDWK